MRRFSRMMRPSFLGGRRYRYRMNEKLERVGLGPG